tara:strand:- start:16723 stop:17259 length:537 start_codon:yes stop_codon:yes gene_type:complete
MSTTNKLAQVIRKIVREEVRKEVRSLLTEQKKPKVTTSEFKTGLQHALGLSDSVERRARKPKVQKQYTKNTMLNDILNETAGEIATGRAPKLQSESGEYPTMGGQAYTTKNSSTFDRNSLAAKMGYGDVAQGGSPTISEMVPRHNTSGGLNHNTEVDPSVAKALTRDYSELVKKFNKK